MLSLKELFQQVIDHPEMKEHMFSIVLDDALDFPIVVNITTQDQHNEEVADVGSEYLFEAGQVRFEVSDNFPGDRHDSFNFPDLSSAIAYALEWQEEYNKKQC